MIVLESLSFSYPQRTKPVFTYLSLTVEPLSWVALLGPDGSGKSTLGKLIAGVLHGYTGLLRLDTSVETGCMPAGYLGGDPAEYLVGLSVEEEIVFGLENLALAPSDMEDRVRRALRWTGLAGMEHRLTHTLSGGEQQKLALAALLALGARVVVLDEALSMLDRPTRLALRALLHSLRRDPGLTVVEITHDMEEALTADRAIFLDDGTIGFDGTPQQFFASERGMQWAELRGGAAALRAALLRRGMKNGINEEGGLAELLTRVMGG
ncbi:MAG: energy-coupling factor ABC transporter ATP-binding protein [Desulfomonile tiedjei]|nr:energy-coupling factor ABC transporter ATP-binding protein [Desulfomonile tiedjei]